MAQKNKKLTPMMQQYMKIKNQYKDHILFYRLGDFYEMFFDDAVLVSKELELTLTARHCGLEEKAPLCGVPYHSADTYLAKLIQKGYKVAICEQVEDPAMATGLVKREVVRILTPGTVIEPSMLSDKVCNYVMSVSLTDNGYGIAFSDITTGEVYATSLALHYSIDKIIDEILKHSPSEILIADNQALEYDELVLNLQKLGSLEPTKISQHFYNADNATATIKRVFQLYDVNSLGIETAEILSSVGSLLGYIQDTQKVELTHFKSVYIYNVNQYMILDSFTRRNLELTEAIRHKQKKGTLLWVLDKTMTAMGARRLRKWMNAPLLDKIKIESRHDAIEELYNDPVFLSDIRKALDAIYDLERLTAKIVYKNVNARDLIALKTSIENLPYIQGLLAEHSFGMLKQLYNNIDILDDVYELIDKAILDEPPTGLKEGNLFKSSYHEDIAIYRDAMDNGTNWIMKMQNTERERTGIKSLKIGFNKVFGYYIEVTRVNSELVPEYYERKQTLANTERYITPELKELENTVLGAKEKLIELEYQLFVELRNSLSQQIGRILTTAEVISKLDVLQSLAIVAQRYQYTRPIITEDRTLNIVAGRHPVVERISANELFMPNDTLLDDNENQFSIITGPNMSGKSTYLRQVALIVFLAQIGSFVPATSAQIGIVDRIFTRVGASDDLAQGQSTFMVEMSELANILRNATSKSLVILDEIGRGTSTYDGLSIAWAVVEYMTEDGGIGAKSMFATHYHELTELEGKFKGVKNFRIDVSESGDEIVFLHRILRGSANKSYGIQVAQLAGVPNIVVQKAKNILKKLENNDINRKNLSEITDAYREDNCIDSGCMEDMNQYKNINADSRDFIDKLVELDIDDMSPRQCQDMLYELCKDAKEIIKD